MDVASWCYKWVDGLFVDIQERNRAMTFRFFKNFFLGKMRKRLVLCVGQAGPKGRHLDF